MTGRIDLPQTGAIIDAVGRRDQTRSVIDGMTAANDLGFTTAVPSKIVFLTDVRLRPIQLGNQDITFKQTAPSKLYWAGHPAMRIVQALHWLQDVIQAGQSDDVIDPLRDMLGDPGRGQVLRDDLRDGLPTLPIWMQTYLRDLLNEVDPALPLTLGKPLRRQTRNASLRHAGGRHERDIQRVLAASPEDRRGLFTKGARRLGTSERYVEKDFWVCWTLDTRFNDRSASEPRLLFKGGTSLSKAFGIIPRFSEDIDITVFRDDLGEEASLDAMEVMSGKARSRQLDAIRDHCSAYVTGPLHDWLADHFKRTMADARIRDRMAHCHEGTRDGFYFNGGADREWIVLPFSKVLTSNFLPIDFQLS